MIAWVLRLAHRAVVLGECGLPEPGLPANTRRAMAHCSGCVVGGWIAAVFFLGMGLLALAVPSRIVEIFGGKADTAASRTEVRAVYGGYGLGSCALTIAALYSEVPEAAGWLQALAVAMASMAFGRVLGAAFERDLSLYPTWAFVMVELLLAAALAAAGAVFSSG